MFDVDEKICASGIIIYDWVKKAKNDPEAQALSERLSEKLGSQVSIVRSSNGKAKLTISVDEPHKLEQLVAILEG